MAKTPKLTATLPDGSIATRETARDYAFVIAIEPRPADVEVAELLDEAARQRETAAAFDAAIARGEVKLRSRGLGRAFWEDGKVSYHSHEAFLVGGPHSVTSHASEKGESEIYGEYTPEGEYVSGDKRIISAREAVLGSARGYALRARQDAEKADARAAGILDGSIAPELEWRVIRWTSRADLAQKALASSEVTHWTKRGYRAHVLPVD